MNRCFEVKNTSDFEIHDNSIYRWCHERNIIIQFYVGNKLDVGFIPGKRYIVLRNIDDSDLVEFQLTFL